MGRTGRQRKKSRQRRAIRHVEGCGQESEGADVCTELRKWMVSRSSKSELENTFNLVPFYFQATGRGLKSKRALTPGARVMSVPKQLLLGITAASVVVVTPSTGRGLKTKRALTPGATVVSVPQQLLLTPAVVLNSPLGVLLKSWGTPFTPHLLLVLFLLVERHRGDHSRWQPFLASLPPSYTLPHYFTADEVNALPSHVALLAQRMVQRARQAYKQALRFCSRHWDDAACWVTWGVFRWAWCAVCSRAVFLETERGTETSVDLECKDENNVALCPYLDLLNHSATARVRAGLNGASGTYEIVSDDPYEAHQQVFISYGPHDNATLFLHYGFTLPHNANNAVCFSVDDFGDLRNFFKVNHWEQKMAVLHKNGLNKGLSCTMEGVSWNLMSALKVLALDWEQLQKSERVLTGEALPPVVVQCARRMAKQLITGALARCQALLAKQPTGELSAHSSITKSLALDEVTILTVALHDVS